MQPICWKMGCKSADSWCKKGKDAYIEKGEGLLRSGAKQYVDGGETIRRWRRNNTSMEAKRRVDRACPIRGTDRKFTNLWALLREPSGIASPTFGHYFGNLWASNRVLLASLVEEIIQIWPNLTNQGVDIQTERFLIDLKDFCAKRTSFIFDTPAFEGF